MRNRCLTDEHLHALLEGELTCRLEPIFIQHLEACPDCAERMKEHAGDERWWADAELHLAEFGWRSDGTGTADCNDLTHAVPATAHLTSGAFDHIKQWLAPTDDPEKLGRVGRFEVVGLIGVGGSGIVLKAFDARLNRFVAIKTLLPSLADDAPARVRFERESRAVAAISHQNVVPIHTVDQHDGIPYIAMQYVAGRSLQHRIEQEGPLAPVDIARIAAQIARGLAAAHSQGVIHRDIKPSNIMLEEGGRALVTDFGLARVVDDASFQSGSVTGTPRYMSPEQCAGQRTGLSSDLFSLGSVIYAMSAGRPPFRSETLMGTLRNVCESEPRDIRELNPDIPAWLEELVKRLHRKKPDDRLESASCVAEILEREIAHMQNPTVIGDPDRSWMPKPTSNSSQRPYLGRSMMLIAASALAALVTFAVMQVPATSQRPENVSPDAPDQIVVGDGKRVEMSRSLGSFSKLRVMDGVVTVVRSGKQLEIKVIGESNMLQHLRTRIRRDSDGDRLEVDVYTDEGISIRPTLPLELHVTTPELALLDIEDNSIAFVDQLDATDFTLVASDTARVVAAGSSAYARIVVDDTAKIDANNLNVQRMSLKADDHATVVVQVQEDLTIQAQDWAKVQYIGSPSRTSINTDEQSEAINVTRPEAMSSDPTWMKLRHERPGR